MIKNNCDSFRLLNPSGVELAELRNDGTLVVQDAEVDSDLSLTGDFSVGGDVTVTSGSVSVTAGDVLAPAGAISCLGNLTATSGDIVANTGDLIATTGAVSAAQTVTAGTGIICTSGNISAQGGDLISTGGVKVQGESSVIGARFYLRNNNYQNQLRLQFDGTQTFFIGQSSAGDLELENSDITKRVSINSTQASTDKDSGGLVVDSGGLGVEGNINSGGYIKTISTTDSSSVSTGAIITAGGAGIAKNLFVGTGVTITGTKTEDLRVPLETTKLGGVKDPDYVVFRTNGAGSTGVFSYAFDPTAEEEVFFAVQLPHTYAYETSIVPHVHWSPSDNNAGTVSWGLEYCIAEINDTFPATTTIIASSAAASGTSHAHQYHEIGTITMTGVTTPSAVIKGRLFRDATGAIATDSYAADAYLHEFDFHFQSDKVLGT
ncbi:hypothetical protein KJ807_05500 [Patescibacteria group bacterium]|nr:hypothetical protein [Patescibacteria group bacterium]